MCPYLAVTASPDSKLGDFTSQVIIFWRNFSYGVQPCFDGLLFVGKRLAESTNGFRAIRVSTLDDPRINLHQRWLDGDQRAFAPKQETAGKASYLRAISEHLERLTK